MNCSSVENRRCHFPTYHNTHHSILLASGPFKNVVSYPTPLKLDVVKMWGSYY